MKTLLWKFFFITCSLCSFLLIASAQSNHTITIDGTNDFSADENLGSESGRTGYLTWDATNVYIGITGNPIVSTSSNVYVVFDTDPAASSDPRVSGIGRSDQPTTESGGATYPFSANLVYQFFGTGSDDGSAQNPAPGNKYTISGGAWSSASIPSGVRIIRVTAGITEIEIPFSDIGVSTLSEFNVIFYVANSSIAGSNFAQWPTGNDGGNSPTLKDFFTYTRESGETQNAGTHSSYREHSTTGYTIGNSTHGSIFFVPGLATTYTCGLLTTLGYHLYMGTNATFSMGSNITSLFVFRNVTNDGTLTLSTASGGDLTADGNFSSNGTLNPNGRTLSLNSSNAQTLSGSSLTFSGLSINNSAGITLNAACTVSGTLTFTAGNLLLGSNKLTLSGSVSGAASGKCAVTNGTGTVERSIAASGSFQFPIASTTSSYNPLTIALAGGDPTETFNVRAQSSVNPAAPDNTLCIQRTWNIGETTPGGNNATLTFQWLSAEHGSNFAALTGQGVFRHTGSVYSQVANLGTVSGSGTAGSPYISTTTTAVTTFSPFVVGTAGGLPIQLSSFTGTLLDNNRVRLNWRTISEINNYGFYVQKRRNEVPEWTEIPNSFIAGHGTTNEPQNYTFTDNGVSTGLWRYRLQQLDLDGTIHYSEPIQVDVVTAVKEVVPSQFALLQNYPNPFNPSTEIKFSVDVTGRTILAVYDLLGQRVATLFDDVAEAGQYYTVTLNASSFSSGVYLYKLENGKKSELRKMMLMK